MQKKKLFVGSRTPTPILGLGTGHLGLKHQNDATRQYGAGPDWENLMDQDTAVAAILAAIDGGVRLFDTAPWYGRGASETALGIALAMRPAIDDIAVATKIGRLYPGDDYDFSYDAAMRSFEGSQRRIGIQKFELVHIHDPMGQSLKAVMGKSGPYEALRNLAVQGVVREVGIGANDPTTAAEYIATGGFDAAIVVGAWSLLNQSARDTIIPLAGAKETTLIAANSLERGILAHGWERVIYQERNFGPDLIDHVTKMKDLCEDFGISLGAAAIQWSVRHPQFTATIPGARTAKQVIQNIGFANEAIPSDFWPALEPLITTWDYSATAYSSHTST